MILAGLGRVGQVVARLLDASGYPPTVLDDDPDHVEQSRKFGFRAFYGDATRLDLLQAAGAASANFLIVTLDDPDATTRLAKIAQKHFPKLRIVARARDMRHMFELRDLGVEVIERETWPARRSSSARRRSAAISGDDGARAPRGARLRRARPRGAGASSTRCIATRPDAHISVSNELRDQLARTLARTRRAIKPDR